MRIAFLTNPASGSGRAARVAPSALARLRAGAPHVDLLVGADRDESLDLAREAVASGVDALVVCGGDGLAHLAIQALACTDVPLGLVPAGTGNDLARSLGIERRDPSAAVDTVLRALRTGRTETIDLARIGDRYFATVLCTGFDAIVNERANQMTWPQGQLRYHLATLAELRVLRPVTYTIDADGEQIRVEATLVAVGNGPSFGGGLRITHGAALDDGLLDVVVIEALNRRELLRAYPTLFTGGHVEHPRYSHRRVRQVTIAAAGIIAYADGERLGPLPMTVEVAPRALRVLPA